MAEEKENSGGRVPAALNALGRFMKGIKEYNVFELLKVLFAGACVTFMVLLIFRPEVIFEQVDKIVEAVGDARDARHADASAFRLRADENMRGELWLDLFCSDPVFKGENGKILPLAVKVIVLIFTGAIALNPMQIGGAIVTTAFTMVIGAFCVAGAIAFGIGGRELAARKLNEWNDKFSKKQ